MASLLIVDDDAAIRIMFSRALAHLGEIDQASGGTEALRLVSAKQYDCILLDLHMPGVDGFVVLHFLGSKPSPNRDTPVYVVTADTSDEARVRAFRRHAIFLLTKPTPIAMLTSLVEATLGKVAARRSHAPAKKSTDEPK